MASRNLSFSAKINRRLVRPSWFFIFMILPTGCIAFAFTQALDYAQVRQGLVGHLDNPTGWNYLDLVLAYEQYPFRWMALTAALFTPYLVTLLVNHTKVQWRKRMRGLFNKVLSSLSLTLVVMLISQYGLSIQAFSLNILAPWFVFLGLTFAVLVLLEKWSTSELDAVARTVIAALSAMSIIITTSVIAHFNLKTKLEGAISSGLLKDLILISLIYVLSVTFAAWIVTKFSSHLDRPPTMAPSEYKLPVILVIVFVLIAIIAMAFEFLWRVFGFADVARSIYGSTITDAVVSNLWNLHNQQIEFRSVICLFIGTTASTSLAALFKVGAYRAWSERQAD